MSDTYLYKIIEKNRCLIYEIEINLGQKTWTTASRELYYAYIILN